MKINSGGSLGSPDVIKLQKVSKNDKADQASDLGREAVADKVDVSGKAREIAEIIGAVKSIPDVRADKVEEIKSLINSGKYVSDPHKIAGKIIDEVI